MVALLNMILIHNTEVSWLRPVRSASRLKGLTTCHAECMSRRQATTLLGSSSILTLLQAPASAAPEGFLTLPTGFLASRDVKEAALCSGPLNGQVAASFTRAIYETVLEQKVLPEQEFQRQVFVLRDREYPYYYEANKALLPRIPDLSDMTGGLSNPTYFNFVYYILWKVVARHVTGPEARTAFVSGSGAHLLELLDPGLCGEAAQAAQQGGGQASQAQLVSLLQRLLGLLQQGGYLCGYQIVWGELPGTWPADWMLQPQLVGEAPQEGPSQGMVMQVRIHRPADIASAVALRSEEDGFWGDALRAMMSHVMQAAGYQQASADEYFYQDSWQAPQGWRAQLLLLLGDPLEQVDVPWNPTTLVQNWTVT